MSIRMRAYRFLWHAGDWCQDVIGFEPAFLAELRDWLLPEERE